MCFALTEEMAARFLFSCGDQKAADEFIAHLKGAAKNKICLVLIDKGAIPSWRDLDHNDIIGKDVVAVEFVSKAGG